jgi:hypothetical protein
MKTIEEQEEIRCLNKSGKERWISKHLTQDPQYMRQMELMVADASQEKAHFESFIEAKTKLEVQEGELQKVDELLEADKEELGEVTENIGGDEFSQVEPPAEEKEVVPAKKETKKK